MILRNLLMLFLGLGLSACVGRVDYGRVPHAQYVADPRCDSANTTGDIALSSEALFIATSRLPDCRGPLLALTSFRADRIYYGRFDPPRPRTGKAGPKIFVPTNIQSEESWWIDLEQAMAKSEGRVLVYVHGYRETPVSTARDSFQMKRLTEFAGPVIQYSWPSQGNLFGYLIDETNLAWDEQNFRRFLTTLATRNWTKEIIIVSHSMGARLVIPAIEFVDRTSSRADASNISNIILASPDVDRQDFERDIAEEILTAKRVNSDRRITVYVSGRDKALGLSRRLHGYPRLGSPRCFDPFEAQALKAQGLPERCYAAKSTYAVVPQKSGLTIIDTTDVGGRSSGHSDFLKAAAACLDFKAVVGGDRDRKTGRLPTRLPHVFLIGQRASKSEKDDFAACKREK